MMQLGCLYLYWFHIQSVLAIYSIVSSEYIVCIYRKELSVVIVNPYPKPHQMTSFDLQLTG